MKTIYIAGPMTGYPHYNYPAFDEAERHARKLGWEVFNPATLSRNAGFDETRDIPDKEFMERAMREDLDHVLKADAMCVLPGWKESRGAKAEAAVAVWRGIPIYAWPNIGHAIELRQET